MDCPNIGNLVLSNESRKGIQRIKSIPGLANNLAKSVGYGQVVNLFVSPTPSAATIYSIQSTDWRLFSRAMFSIPSIARASIANEARDQWIDAQLKNRFAEAKFWEAVANGCTLR